MKITKKSIFIDKKQGYVEDGRAFGFLGCSAEKYQGWFFTWPSEHATISSVAEREQVLDSLDADETCKYDPQIPYCWARQELDKYLRSLRDCRKAS